MNLPISQNATSSSSMLINGDITRPSTREEAIHEITLTSEPATERLLSSSEGQIFPQTSSPTLMIRTGYVYDPLMMLHCQDGYTPTADHVQDSGEGHPEEPMRIKRIFSRLAESGLIRRMKRLDFGQVTFDQVLLVHTADHWNKVQGTESKLTLTQRVLSS